MSGISGVSGSNYQDYGRFASGKEINSAADGASELSIIEKEESVSRGYDVGADNIGSAQDLLRTADGALGSITDYLQRMRELALKASNTAVMSDDDIRNIQKEIDQLKQGIADVADQTQYNGKNLLDGSNPELNVATDANGGRETVTLGEATLKALGIEDFDVTGDFDLDALDKAIDTVSGLRSDAGAKSNALEYAYNSNRMAAYNSTASRSRIEDLDYAEAISEQKKNETLRDYQMILLRKKMEDEAIKTQNFFA